jgi:3-oxoacyl-[acyl-carrier protein] reductase
MSELPVMAITGTSRGVGRYLSEYYTNKNWIVAGCSRSPSDFSHEHYYHSEVDITAEDQINRWIRTFFRRFGRLDSLINNAGTAAMNHTLLTPARSIDRLMNLNVKGTMLACREAGKMMQKQNFGRIINFSTIAVALSLEGEAVYVASKAAVENYSKVLAKELARWNITVNVIAPLPIKTDLIKNVPKDKLQHLLDRLVIKRYGEFDDVANVTDFFISPRSSVITGQIITMGGC